MGCQCKIAKKIVKDAKADYVLNLKANQETLLNEVEGYFRDLQGSVVMERLNDQMKSANKQQTIENAFLQVQKNDHTSLETTFFISSVTIVREFSTAVRSHWGVERLHWCLEVTFKEDANRTRKDKAPNNMDILKRLAFNVVKKDTTQYPTESMKSK